jgi:methyl-accepting chemotaxis protein
MDVITQQNAANAEETASASEEMSAQAQNTKEQVDVLLSQVGGRAGKVLFGNSEESFKRGQGLLGRKIGLRQKKTNGDGRENALHKADLEKALPLGEDRTLKHDEKN